MSEPRRRTPDADGGLDPHAQTWRRCFARQVLANQPLQDLDTFALGRKCRIGRHTPLHRKCIDRIELAIS
jgi:hypothetical protein